MDNLCSSKSRIEEEFEMSYLWRNRSPVQRQARMLRKGKKVERTRAQTLKDRMDNERYKSITERLGKRSDTPSRGGGDMDNAEHPDERQRFFTN